MIGSRWLRSRALLAALLALAPGVDAARQNQEPSRAVPETVRFAFSTFERADTLVSKAPYQAVEGFLGELADHSSRESGQKTLAFEVSLGNDYQVLQWLRDGEVDAALLSPFVLWLLEGQKIAEPVAEVASLGRDGKPTGDPRGFWPVAFSSRNGRENVHPLRDYDAFLRETERAAAGELYGFKPDESSRFEVSLVSHLSTSGFFLPLAYAKVWLEARIVRDHAWTEERRQTFEQLFWQRYFERIRLTWTHPDACPEPPVGLIGLYFSDSPSRATPAVFSNDEAKGSTCQQLWVSVAFDPSEAPQLKPETSPKVSGPEVPSLPHDVLVVSQRLLSRRPDWKGAAGEVLRAMSPPSEGEPLFRDPQAAPQKDIRERFSRLAKEVWENHGRERDRATKASSPSFLQGLYRRWYEDGRYELSVPDAIGFLLQDQKTSAIKNAALVLPGGGVKSAYQAQMLDLLYGLSSSTQGSPLLANRPPRSEATLHVDHVVGTSGGAIMGLLAAQIGVQPAAVEEKPSSAECPKSDGPLACRWRSMLQSTRAVFPVFGLPRWVSFLVLLLVFNVSLAIASRVKQYPLPEGGSRSRQLHTPGWVAALTAVHLVALPITLALVLDPRAATDFHRASLWNLALVLLAFASQALTYDLREATVDMNHLPRLESWARRALWGTLASAIALLAAAWLYHLGAAPQNDGFESTVRLSELLVAWLVGLVSPALAGLDNPSRQAIFGAALCITYLCGLLLVAFGYRPKVRIHRGSELAGSLLILVAYFGLSHLLLFLAVEKRWLTWFELSGIFWLMLVLAGVMTSFTILALGWSRARGFRGCVRACLRHLTSLERRRFVVTTPSWALLFFSVLAFGLWTFALGHGLYSSNAATKTMRALITETFGERGEAFATPLVVTGTALGKSDAINCQEGYEPGDYYFCFDGPKDQRCPELGQRRWQVRQRPLQPGSIDWVLDPVFASGSPFPVFPAHSVTLADGCSLALVDGGYTHVEPTEAAAKLDARQVLIVRSQPDPRLLLARKRWFNPVPFPSQLPSRTASIFPFLFGRSQEMDRNVNRGMVVVALTPHPAHGEFPFLTDFRPKVVDRMIRFAGEDFTRPIGTLEGLGRPVIIDRIVGKDER